MRLAFGGQITNQLHRFPGFEFSGLRRTTAVTALMFWLFYQADAATGEWEGQKISAVTLFGAAACCSFGAMTKTPNRRGQAACDQNI